MSSRSILAASVAGVLLAGCASGGGGAPGAGSPAADGMHWVASWGAAQLVPEGQNALPAEQWRDATLRQVVRVSAGGDSVRVRLSNAFGTAPLAIDAASLALSAGPGQAALRPGSVRALRFGGSAAVTIPAGAEYLSDPVRLAHAAGADLAISLHFAAEPARQTGHPGARATSFVARGEQTMAPDLADAARVTRWYQIAGVEVLAAPATHAVVAIGDSITDGYGVDPDTNARWTDHLATRLRASGMAGVSVVNAGIGGGRMLRDGLGPNLAARFERDVVQRPGATHAIVMIGVNDFGVPHRAGEDSPAARRQLLEDLEQAQRQIVQRAHAAGICVLGATVTPYAGSGYYKPGPENEQDRQDFNRWIRTSGTFDGVVDFDAALRDPARPDYLRKEFDNDGLHPSAAGYRAMGQAVPLDALRGCRHAPAGRT
ncbi:SGNH/GDSL hydrolase family protein [Massilia forsythiae]|uniref:SGNH/GDSL hydrolase family protein n=1 Tax=Massilia forsythiae TaxID=2728020 RepID=A0A7Z2VZE9_9BURK|nr:SGNH/GDSL hydrolase family protein [Massilia forsythiae]QJE02044.1 SGNH/GDSL hydrolase family protein [Massilia forsythiae]